MLLMMVENRVELKACDWSEGRYRGDDGVSSACGDDIDCYHPCEENVRQ